MTELYPYQERGVRRIERFGGRALLADEMGLGKTIQALTYALRHPEARPAVVVCPASLRWNWEREAKHHVGLRAQVLEGTRPDLGLLKRSRLLVINYDVLYAWLEELRRLDPQLVVLDEVHYCASPGARRSKAAFLLCQGVPHVIGLSGTPLTNRPIELWHPLRIIRPELFPNRVQFAVRYCKRRRTPWGWDETGACNLEELNEVLRKGRGGVPGVLIRRRKAQVLKELPAKTRSVSPLDLTGRSEYEEALRDFKGWLTKHSPHKLRGAMRAEAVVKLGYLKRLVAKLKLPAVHRWVDNFLGSGDGKLVLFATHRKVITALHERYGRACVVVDGSVTGRKRQQAVDEFQHKARVRLFVGNIKAAGVGLTLTAASTVAFCELGWSPGDHAQAEDRCHRIGQRGNVQAVYLLGRDTLEERLLELIQKKAAVLNQTLDGGKGTAFDVVEKLTQELLTGGKR